MPALRRPRLPIYSQDKTDQSNVTCQRCLEKGHWTFMCKGKRKYLERESYTTKLGRKLASIQQKKSRSINANKRSSSSSSSDSSDSSENDSSDSGDDSSDASGSRTTSSGSRSSSDASSDSSEGESDGSSSVDSDESTNLRGLPKP